MNNKISFLINPNKPAQPCTTLASKVRTRIDNYLSCISCFELLHGTDSLIFGGAVRDSIANLEIHDVDIAVLPNACGIIMSRLKHAGFKQIEKCNIDISSLYTNSLIQEPHTFYKNDAFVQLIRVRANTTRVSYDMNDLHNIVKNVDISCCAVSFFPNSQGAPPNSTLKEYHANAIFDCLDKQFKVLKNTAFYNKKRIDYRIHKLVARGWQDCTPNVVDDVMQQAVYFIP
jgi:hypothetical protein